MIVLHEKLKGPLKSLQFILKGTWTCEQKFTTIHPSAAETFQSGPNSSQDFQLIGFSCVWIFFVGVFFFFSRDVILQNPFPRMQQSKWRLAWVSPDVFCQVAAASETSPACFAGVRFLSRVDPYVPLQVWPPTESFPTGAAGVRSLTCVRPHVKCQVTGPPVRFST